MIADLGDVRLGYDDRGDGDAVILLGGFGTVRGYWDELLPYLDGLRVITVDLRGVGETVWSGGFGIPDLAEDVVGLMDRLEVDTAVVLGWSMGSQVAMSMAADHPERVSGLVLISAFTRLPLRSMYLLRELTARYADGRAPEDCLSVAVNAFCMTESDFQDMHDTGMEPPLPEKPSDPKGLIAQLDAMAEWDSGSDLCCITAPVLVIHGTEDIMVDHSIGLAISSALGDSQVLLVGAGHAIPFKAYGGDLREFAVHCFECREE